MPANMLRMLIVAVSLTVTPTALTMPVAAKVGLAAQATTTPAPNAALERPAIGASQRSTTVSDDPTLPSMWTIKYVFGTYLYGGTTLNVDSSGAYRLTAAATRILPKTERTGTLSRDELAALRSAVSGSQPSLWSASYGGSGICLDWGVYIVLDRPAKGATGTPYRSSWSCGMNGVPEGLRTLTTAIRANILSRIPQALTDGGPSRRAMYDTTHDVLRIEYFGGTRAVTIAADEPSPRALGCPRRSIRSKTAQFATSVPSTRRNSPACTRC